LSETRKLEGEIESQGERLRGREGGREGGRGRGRRKRSERRGGEEEVELLLTMFEKKIWMPNLSETA
jgi:hypothetical protein